MLAKATTVGLCLLLLLPAAQAQSGSAETTLYFHVFDTFNKFPINTQPMDVEFFEVGGTNFPTVEEHGWDFNTIYGYSTAGPVEYDFIENGRPRFHPERGIAADVELDPAVEPVTYIYVDVRDVRGQDTAPMALPTYTLEVTMRTGDDAGDTAKLDEGDMLMHGKMTAHIADGHSAPVNDQLAGQEGPDGTPILVPDGNGIIEFAIPMEVSSQAIPKDEAYNVRIDWYQAGEAAGDDEVSTGYFRLAADQQHLPRMELAVKNPVYVEFVHPQVAAGTLLIHTGVNSPWGTYDIDVGNMSLTITDSAGEVVKQHTGRSDDGSSAATALQRFVSQGAHVHNQHDKAAEITYMWPFRAEGAKNGEYTIELTVPNLRGNAEATATAKFTIEGKKAFGESDTGEIVEPVSGDDGGNKESPGLGPLGIVALLGVALRRWRA